MDPPDVSARFRDNLGARFRFLSDQKGELLDRLNIRHNKGYSGKDIAFPTAILVDKFGIVRWIYEMAYGNVRMRPAELFEILERMALKEQNRELLRGRSVSRVVEQVFLMKRSRDLASVIRVMRKELERLGSRCSFCGITIFDMEQSVSRTYGASAVDSHDAAEDPKEGHSLTFVELPMAGIGEIEQVVSSWKQGKVYYRNYDEGETSEYLDSLKGTSNATDIAEVVKSFVHVPFSHGMISIGDDERDQFAEDKVQTLREFASAISVGYQRFVDFKELDRRNRELVETQLKLVQTEKLASLGELVAGIAHELNTPMGAIKSNTQITSGAMAKFRSLLSDLGNGEQDEIAKLVSQLETLNQVNRGAAERVIKIIDSLRSFARLDEAEWKVVDLHQGMDDTLTLIQPRLGDRVRIQKSYGSIPDVGCYPKKMNQVFMTLLANAEQAIEEDGEIVIETTSEGEWALIKISDTGAGIPHEHLQRIFDPGFTTKGVGVGTGLGLPICYQIIEEHEGTIEVVSEVGKGSTFTIKIPIRNERKSPSQAVANLEGTNRN